LTVSPVAGRGGLFQREGLVSIARDRNGTTLDLKLIAASVKLHLQEKPSRSRVLPGGVAKVVEGAKRVGVVFPAGEEPLDLLEVGDSPETDPNGMTLPVPEGVRPTPTDRGPSLNLQGDFAARA
jgi:hypothetical protein